MRWKNSPTRFGAIAQFFHWTTAAAFIAAYLVVYYSIWFIDDDSAQLLPVLNVHWALGLLVGALTLPRLIWRICSAQPEQTSAGHVEHLLARLAHYGLYMLMILMPLTGYLGTSAPTDFGLFAVPSFRDTYLFEWIGSRSGATWETFEPPVDSIHHFLGKWVAWVVVCLHIAAALLHHYVRRDDVLLRMLPGSRRPVLPSPRVL